MHSLTISETEQDYLRELLGNTLSDLRAEIAHTDSPFYKDELREKKKVISGLIEKLEHETAEAR